MQGNLELIDHKIGVYRGRLAAGDADRPWASGDLDLGQNSTPGACSCPSGAS